MICVRPTGTGHVAGVSQLRVHQGVEVLICERLNVHGSLSLCLCIMYGKLSTAIATQTFSIGRRVSDQFGLQVEG